jgi:8-amino-7-oxononanoate synthase
MLARPLAPIKLARCYPEHLFDKLRAAAARAGAVPAGAPIPSRTVLDGAPRPAEAVIDGRAVLMLGSNNYLGLSTHPEVVEAAAAALRRYGTGTTGSRVANGTLDLHTALEHQFASYFGMPQAHVFTTGYQANLAVLTALCGADDVLLLDADCHASLVDAARLSRAELVWFRHSDPANLRAKLSRLPGGPTNRLVVVEGVYSIRGDVAPLRDIVNVCREFGAYVLVDEAHAFGVFGERGLGVAEAQGVLDEIAVVVGTFSKALGAVGGFCVSDHAELAALPAVARPYMFTASGTPATMAGVSAALAVLARDRSLVERFWARVRQFRAGLAAIGYAIGEVESPIIPIFCGSENDTYALWRGLLESGVYVNIVLPPGCPADRCLLRASVSASHTEADIERGLDVFRMLVANPARAARS